LIAVAVPFGSTVERVKQNALSICKKEGNTCQHYNAPETKNGTTSRQFRSTKRYRHFRPRKRLFCEEENDIHRSKQYHV